MVKVMDAPFKSARELIWSGLHLIGVLAHSHTVHLWWPSDVRFRHTSAMINVSDSQSFKLLCLLPFAYLSHRSHRHPSKPHHPFNWQVCDLFTSPSSGPWIQVHTLSRDKPTSVSSAFGISEWERGEGSSVWIQQFFACFKMHTWGTRMYRSSPPPVEKISSAKTHFLFFTLSVVFLHPLAV